MQEELEEMFKRKVDLVEREALRNPKRRHSILSGREIVHAPALIPDLEVILPPPPPIK